MVTLASGVLVPLLATVAAWVAVTFGYYLLRFLARRSRSVRDLVQQAYRPTQTTATLAALWVALWATGTGEWRSVVLHGLLLAIIASTAWLVVALLNVFSSGLLRRLEARTQDSGDARRVRTRLKLVHRVILAVVATLAVGIMLITFDEVRTVGVSLLASAGLVGVVVALAAQSMLGNFFAGLQVAFSDALRLDDVVVVEGHWGTIEEITLRHVVVKIWDERRLILPTSYFANNPFENWTKTDRQLLGVVELDVDWSVPLEEMRAELKRICEHSELWDRRLCKMEVTDATGGLIRVRAVASAANSSAQWGLRCLIREGLVTWLQRHHPEALPRTRAEIGALREAATGQRLDQIPMQP
ncbi:MAG TPA: mechanosensitive ion channel domain-containing protein [Natronosporangium sp.]|nr:mechanosensitive ion channel domain-containing protein [Natronosporangium sp.]